MVTSTTHRCIHYIILISQQDVAMWPVFTSTEFFVSATECDAGLMITNQTP